MPGSRPSLRPAAISPTSPAFHSRIRSWPTRVAIDFHWWSLLHFSSGRPILRARTTPREVEKEIAKAKAIGTRVGSLLRKGVSEETLARQLEAERQDKPKPAYYAQRTVTRAAASLRGEQLTTPFKTHN